jgi:hypothetical protein
MGLGAPDATAENAGGRGDPVRGCVHKCPSRSQNTPEIVDSPLCRLQADANDPYKSEAYCLASGLTEQRISRTGTTEFAQSSGTEKQRVARLELALDSGLLTLRDQMLHCQRYAGREVECDGAEDLSEALGGLPLAREHQSQILSSSQSGSPNTLSAS